MMRTAAPLACLLLVPLISCSSNDGDVDGGFFAPAPRSPGPAQTFLAPAGADGQNVTVTVHVRELSGVAGAVLALDYDAARLVYRSFARGSLLEQDDATVSYDVAEEFPGRLVVRIERTSGGTASADATDPVLVALRFTVVALGDTPSSFDPQSALLNEQSSPLPGIAFFAGTFRGI